MPERSGFERPVPVDPKVFSVRRSAGMVAGAPGLPRYKLVEVTTFFKVVVAVVAALAATVWSSGGPSFLRGPRCDTPSGIVVRLVAPVLRALRLVSALCISSGEVSNASTSPTSRIDCVLL